MSEQFADNTIYFEEAPSSSSQFKSFCRVLLSRGVVKFGLIVVILLIIIAVFAPFIAPYDPNAPDLANLRSNPSIEHWLGTDAVGRDTLSRIIYGSRTSLLVSIVALMASSVIGMSLGLIAGFFGGMTFSVIMRLMDTLMSIPMILLALTIAAILGGGLTNVMIALGTALVPIYARLMCGQVLSIKENDYVMAGKSMGAGNLRLMLRHVFPNCIPPLIVMMTMQLGTTILAEAGLSFLGVGVRPPTPSWGNMVSDGYTYLQSTPILSLAPGLAIMLVVFAFNMLGDGLRDALDPRLRGML